MPYLLNMIGVNKIGMSSQNEFVSNGLVRDRLVCWKYSLRSVVALNIKRLLGRGTTAPINRSYTKRQARRILLREGLAVAGNQPSWFYSAFDRGTHDPMTMATLERIETSVAADSRILVTGCGTGLTVFWLLEAGYSDVSGTDLLPEAIQVAQVLNRRFYSSEAKISVDDALKPSISGTFDVVTALHWVFSAWAGNYGNDSHSDPRSRATRRRLLEEFLHAYSEILELGGVLVIELIDAICDVRLASDHSGGLGGEVYPVRHSLDDVKAVSSKLGFTIQDQYLSYSYGHQARMCYWLKKIV